MEERRFEWAYSIQSDSKDWKLAAKVAQLKDDEEGPCDAFPFSINLRLCNKICPCFKSEQLSGKTWRYEVFDLCATDGDGEWWWIGDIVLREVPPCLILDCRFTIVSGTHFDARFSTLSGREILSTHKPLPPSVRVADLVALATAAAEAHNVLRSCNQEVRIILNGFIGEPDPETVLWKHGGAMSTMSVPMSPAECT